VGPAQQGGGALHVARRHQRPDAGGRHRLGSHGVPGQAHADHLEAVAQAELGQQGHVPLAPVPEVEVLPHHHQPGVERVDQELLHEILGRLVGPLVVEGHHHRPLDAAVGQQLEFLLEVGQELGGRVGPHHAGRVAVEGHHHRREAALRRPGREVAQQGPVPQVDAVVGADGDGCSWPGHRGRG